MQISTTHIAIVGCPGTGKSTLVDALRIACTTGDVQSHGPHQWAVTEAAALMAAVTRDLLFQDASHYPQAVYQHRQFTLTLLTGLDLPSAHVLDEPDGPNTLLQPSSFDQRLRQLMDAQAIPYAVVYGSGQSRTEGALQAIAHQHACQAVRRQPSSKSTTTAWHWACDTCSDAGCEHQLFRRLVQPDHTHAVRPQPSA